MLFVFIMVLLIAERASSSQNDEKGKTKLLRETLTMRNNFKSFGLSPFLTNTLDFLSKQYQSSKLKPYLHT